MSDIEELRQAIRMLDVCDRLLLGLRGAAASCESKMATQMGFPPADDMSQYCCAAPEPDTHIKMTPAR